MRFSSIILETQEQASLVVLFRVWMVILPIGYRESRASLQIRRFDESDLNI